MIKIHEGHQGIERCRSRANRMVWWPGLSKQISDNVHRCKECSKNFQRKVEPLISTKLPEYPWQQVGVDLFYFKGKDYLMVVDYFSRYPEIARLTSTTAQGVIGALKKIFSRHGSQKESEVTMDHSLALKNLSNLVASMVLRILPVLLTFLKVMGWQRGLYKQ